MTTLVTMMRLLMASFGAQKRRPTIARSSGTKYSHWPTSVRMPLYKIAPTNPISLEICDVWMAAPLWMMMTK